MGFRTFLITTAFMIALLAIHMYYTEIRVSQTTNDLKETVKQEVIRLIEENRRQYDDMKTAFGDMSAHMEQISDNTKENRREHDDMKTAFGEMSAHMEQISDNTKDTKPKDCTDIDKRNGSGIYTIYPIGVVPFQVYCDMTTDNGGWTVFQRRVNGQINFQRTWGEYEAGFGDVNSEFWLGNKYLNMLTSQGRYELRIDLEDFENNKRFAKYLQFYVGDASTNYRLTASSYNGNAGNGLIRHHDGSAFSTKDRDNDRSPINCAVSYKGAWWYGKCHDANLNGVYLKGRHPSYADGVNWEKWRGQYNSLKTSVMMLRRVK